MERFAFSDAQAQAIVDMRLRALTGLERGKLEGEYSQADGLVWIAEVVDSEGISTLNPEAPEPAALLPEPLL